MTLPWTRRKSRDASWMRTIPPGTWWNHYFFPGYLVFSLDYLEVIGLRERGERTNKMIRSSLPSQPWSSWLKRGEIDEDRNRNCLDRCLKTVSAWSMQTKLQHVTSYYSNVNHQFSPSCFLSLPERNGSFTLTTSTYCFAPSLFEGLVSQSNSHPPLSAIEVCTICAYSCSSSRWRTLLTTKRVPITNQSIVTIMIFLVSWFSIW